MYASPGSEIFKLKGDSLVTGLAEVQAALGNGYLGAYPEALINRNIRGTSVWAPWYLSLIHICIELLHNCWLQIMDTRTVVRYLFILIKQLVDVF